MSKYIDVDKLKELIDEKWKELADKNVKVGGGKYDVEISTYLSVLRLIDSIQLEVDLKKEVRTYCCSSFRFNYDELNDSFYSNAFEFDDAVELARHFYELGQQEMRHRITNPEYNAKVVEQLKSEYPTIKEE